MSHSHFPGKFKKWKLYLLNPNLTFGTCFHTILIFEVLLIFLKGYILCFQFVLYLDIMVIVLFFRAVVFFSGSF